MNKLFWFVSLNILFDFYKKKLFYSECLGWTLFESFSEDAKKIEILRFYFLNIFFCGTWEIKKNVGPNEVLRTVASFFYRYVGFCGSLHSRSSSDSKGLHTRWISSPGYLELEPKIVEKWPNKGISKYDISKKVLTKYHWDIFDILSITS